MGEKPDLSNLSNREYRRSPDKYTNIMPNKKRKPSRTQEENNVYTEQIPPMFADGLFDDTEFAIDGGGEVKIHKRTIAASPPPDQEIDESPENSLEIIRQQSRIRGKIRFWESMDKIDEFEVEEGRE